MAGGTLSLDSLFEATWVELTFFDVVENSIVCSRFMSRVDFPGLWVMANFLDKITTYVRRLRCVSKAANPSRHSSQIT